MPSFKAALHVGDIIVAQVGDLKKEIADGKFREDLYHRLAVILINVPSLNERVEDIPLLDHPYSRYCCHSANQ